MMRCTSVVPWVAFIRSMRSKGTTISRREMETTQPTMSYFSMANVLFFEITV